METSRSSHKGCGMPDWGSLKGKELKTGRGLGFDFEFSKFEML